MYELKASGHFDSAHFLPGYAGKCANLHGHRWTVTVTVSGKNLRQGGETQDMLLDFSELKQTINRLCDAFDHKLLCKEGSLLPQTKDAFSVQGFAYVELPFSPTAERLAEYFYRACERSLPVVEAAVYETPDNLAVFREDA